MTSTRKPTGISGWWLALGGAVFLVVGLVLFGLDSAGIIDAHSRPRLVFTSLTLGAVFLIMGVVMGVKGTRVTDDGRNRYGKRKR